jgi:hypothetical protein
VPVLRAFIENSESRKVVVVVITAVTTEGISEVRVVGLDGTEVEFPITGNVVFTSVVMTRVAFLSNTSFPIKKLSSLIVETGLSNGTIIFSDTDLSIMRSENSLISSILMSLLNPPIGSDHSLAKSRRQSFFCVEVQMSSTSGARKDAAIRKKNIINKDLSALLEGVFRLKPLMSSINGQ